LSRNQYEGAIRVNRENAIGIKMVTDLHSSIEARRHPIPQP